MRDICPFICIATRATYSNRGLSAIAKVITGRNLGFITLRIATGRIVMGQLVEDEKNRYVSSLTVCSSRWVGTSD